MDSSYIAEQLDKLNRQEAEHVQQLLLLLNERERIQVAIRNHEHGISAIHGARAAYNDIKEHS